MKKLQSIINPHDIDCLSATIGFCNPPSFNTSIISLMDTKTSLIAGHTAASAVAGFLSPLKKPLLCKWSLMPAKMIVIGFISVSRWTPTAIDMYSSNPDQFPPALSRWARTRTWRCSQSPSSQLLLSSPFSSLLCRRQRRWSRLLWTSTHHIFLHHLLV